MAKKPTKTKAKYERAKVPDVVRVLRAENKALRKRVAELEARTPGVVMPVGEVATGEVITVQVGPLMPWETALPNSFKVT